MREIWCASKIPGHPQRDRIVGWWWAGWIVSNILGNVSFQIAMAAIAAKDVETLSTASVASVVYEVSDVFAITLALFLITRLSRMQKARRSEQMTATLPERSAA